MDITTITSLVGTLGFPIVAFFVIIKYGFDKIDELTKAINENNIILTRLVEKLGSDEIEVKTNKND